MQSLEIIKKKEIINTWYHRKKLDTAYFNHNMQMSKISCYKTVCIVCIKRTELCIYVNRNKIGYVSVKMLHDSIMLCASLYFLYFLQRTHLLYN